ncbi:MAG: family peptidase [Fibrobacteres bacterium]|nr:family peptidase [Fibrobacterota bacterium]
MMKSLECGKRGVAKQLNSEVAYYAEKRVSMISRILNSCLVLGLVSITGATAATDATDASKTVVVVSSDNPKISGQLFHPKICPNFVNYIAFVRQIRDNRQIWLFDSKTKELTQITPHAASGKIEDVNIDEDTDQSIFKGYEDELEWCPVLHDGIQYYLYVSAGGVNNHDIYISAIGSKTHTRLTFDPEVDGTPRWSPDGKSVVFVSARTGDGDLYLVPDITKYLGKDIKREARNAFERLTTNPGEEMFPSYSPDGRFLAYTTRTSGNKKRGLYTIALMDFKDDHKIKIFNNQITNNKSHPSWSFDGHFVAYQISNDLNDRVVDIGVMQLKVDPQGHLVEVADLHGKTPKIAENVYPSSYTGPTWLPGSRAIVYAKRESSRLNPLEVVNLEKWLYDQNYTRATITTQSNIHRDVDCLPNHPIIVFAGQSGLDFQIFASVLIGTDLRLGAEKVDLAKYDLFKN